jgi:hypothetical protein
VKHLIARAAAIVTAAATLASCTSGGSVAPIPPPTPAITLTVQQQAYEATAGMALTNGIRVASIFALLLHTGDARRPATAPVCENGVEQTLLYTPDGVEATVDVFYDPKCKHIFVASKLLAEIVPPSSVQLNGTATTYDTSGRPVAYATTEGTSKIAGSNSTTVLTGGVSASKTGPAFLSFGLTCNVAQAASGPNSCGFGALSNLPAATSAFGVTSQIDGFVASGPGSGTVALSAYTGKPGSLTLKQGKGDGWIVSGGRAVVRQTGTFSETVDDSTYAVDVALSVKDKLHDANSSVRLGDEGMSGKVYQTSVGLTAASFRTTPLGSGSIDYSNGTTGKIVFFIVAT